eukprot:TRINITY_DN25913_c0_g1_i1.p1 TRINITY_DN25913_c0_g1~~TRINITY_DN25913_c0_g1_i1.p1  ORF type:complete len:550 (-),score=136.65 TRINITY_DN25913_c0_g1_i1:60-1610(-)
MASADSDLAKIQVELQAVKKALQNEASYLGLKGEALGKYLLQLNEKENLLLAQQVRRLAVSDNHFEPLLPAAVGGSGGGYSAGYSPLATNGSAGLSHAPRAPPGGDVKAFNRESLQEVLTHAEVYEGVPVECAKALKALSTLAYKNAKVVGEEGRALPVLLRGLTLHPKESAVQLTGMRALSNMAYDQEVALKHLAEPEVLGKLLTAMGGNAEPKEISARASEALARIIAAEVKPDSDGGGPPPEKPVQISSNSLGALVGLFLAACRGGLEAKEVVPRLLQQLSANEVMEAKKAAEGFVRCEQECKEGSEAAGWLALAKILTPPDAQNELPAALVDAGAIRAAAGIMGRFVRDRLVQLTGIEAMSSLVGNRWDGLRAFADVGGMERVEEAMRHHSQDATIQTKGVRALGSGILWPADVQERARYSHRRAVELTKTAMSHICMDPELQIAALEALSKYLDKTKCVQEVKDQGGEGLVKMIMTSHHDNAKVQQFGRQVLKGIGADSTWEPRAVSKADV